MTNNVTTFWFASHEHAWIFATTLNAHDIPAHVCDFHTNRMFNLALTRYHGDIRVIIPTCFYDDAKQIINERHESASTTPEDELTSPDKKMKLYTFIWLTFPAYGLLSIWLLILSPISWVIKRNRADQFSQISMKNYGKALVFCLICMSIWGALAYISNKAYPDHIIEKGKDPIALYEAYPIYYNSGVDPSSYGFPNCDISMTGEECKQLQNIPMQEVQK